jgi:hypothetical protein
MSNRRKDIAGEPVTALHIYQSLAMHGPHAHAWVRAPHYMHATVFMLCM